MSVYTFQLSFIKEKAWGGKKKKQQFLMFHKKVRPRITRCHHLKQQWQEEQLCTSHANEHSRSILSEVSVQVLAACFKNKLISVSNLKHRGSFSALQEENIKTMLGCALEAHMPTAKT